MLDKLKNTPRMTLAFNGRNLGKSIVTSKFLTIFFLFSFFKTSGFEAVPFLPTLANAMLVLESIFFLTIVLLMRMETPFLLFILGMEFWSYGLAPIITKHPFPSTFYCCGAIGIICLFEIGFYYSPKKFLDSVSDTFMVMVTANLLSSFLPNGLAIDSGGTKIYLFGMRTGFTSVIIPGVLFCLLYDLLFRNKKLSWRSLITVACGATSLFKFSVGTGKIEMGVIVLFTIISILRQNKNKSDIDLFKTLVVILVVDFMITVIGASYSIFENIAKMIGKDPTFSGRTYIWRQVLKAINREPIFGHGLNSTVLIYQNYKPAHNQWFHTALEGGLPAFIFQILGIAFACKNITRYRDRSWSTLISIFIIAILVGCISEIQIYVPFFYAVFDLAYLIPRYDAECESEKQDEAQI